MTRTRPSYTPTPRIWKGFQVATRLGCGETKFDTMRPHLEAMGFPQYDDILGGWDANAIEAWLDKRAGLSDSCDQIDADTEIDRWETSQCDTS